MALFFTLTIACLVNFGSLSPESPEKDALTLRTYGELLEQVGGGKLTSKVLSAMAKSGDPFRLGETNTDHSSLSKRLRELEGMLKQKGWDSPPLRQQLVGELRRRAAALDTAVERREKAANDLWNAFDIAGVIRTQIYSPDGRYAISNGTDALYVVDTVTKTTDKQIRPRKYQGAPYFSPDGQELIFSSNGNQADFVPYKEGKVDWPRAREVFRQDGNTPPAFFVDPTTDPNIYYGAVRFRTLVQRYDIKSGTVQDVPRPPEIEGSEILNGSVPNQNRYYFVVGDLNRYRLYMTTYDAKGAFTVETNDRYFPEKPGHIQFSADGEWLIATLANLGSRAFISPTRGGAVEPLRTNAGSDDFRGTITGYQSHPFKNEGFLFVEEEGKTSTRVEVVDLKTKKSRQVFELPYSVRNPRVTPDGKRLLINHPHGTTLTVINLEPRLNP